MTRQEYIKEIIDKCSKNTMAVGIHTSINGGAIIVVPQKLYLKKGETTLANGIEETQIEYFADYIRIYGDIEPDFDKGPEHYYDYDYINDKAPKVNKRNIYIPYDQIVMINELLKNNWSERLQILTVQ